MESYVDTKEEEWILKNKSLGVISVLGTSPQITYVNQFWGDRPQIIYINCVPQIIYINPGFIWW